MKNINNLIPEFWCIIRLLCDLDLVYAATLRWGNRLQSLSKPSHISEDSIAEDGKINKWYKLWNKKKENKKHGKAKPVLLTVSQGMYARGSTEYICQTNIYHHTKDNQIQRRDDFKISIQTLIWKSQSSWPRPLGHRSQVRGWYRIRLWTNSYHHAKYEVNPRKSLT